MFFRDNVLEVCLHFFSQVFILCWNSANCNHYKPNQTIIIKNNLVTSAKSCSLCIKIFSQILSEFYFFDKWNYLHHHLLFVSQNQFPCFVSVEYLWAEDRNIVRMCWFPNWAVVTPKPALILQSAGHDEGPTQKSLNLHQIKQPCLGLTNEAKKFKSSLGGWGYIVIDIWRLLLANCTKEGNYSCCLYFGSFKNGMYQIFERNDSFLIRLMFCVQDV